jgi:hypothetical protein
MTRLPAPANFDYNRCEVAGGPGPELLELSRYQPGNCYAVRIWPKNPPILALQTVYS